MNFLVDVLVRLWRIEIQNRCSLAGVSLFYSDSLLGFTAKSRSSARGRLFVGPLLRAEMLVESLRGQLGPVKDSAHGGKQISRAKVALERAGCR